MAEHELSTPLGDLGDRLAKFREATRKHEVDGVAPGNSSSAAMAFASRSGIGVVATLVCGTGLGWLIDHWLGTIPLFLILFFVLGAGAGLFNIFWAARPLQP